MTQQTLAQVVPDPQQKDLHKDVQVQQMFDRIAGTYDQLNNWISLGFHKRWKRLACQKLQLKPDAHVLDVCTGTGDLIAHLLPLVGPNGQVDGLDFSENMLEVAHERFASQFQVRLTQGDALALPYPDDYFDGAIISFGLRNVVDIPKALSEMYRVIKPGGWMVNLDTSPTPQLPGMKFYFSQIMPKLGALLSQDQQAYRYLSASTNNFLTPTELKTLFESIGCHHVISETLMLGSVSFQAGQKV